MQMQFNFQDYFDEFGELDDTLAIYVKCPKLAKILLRHKDDFNERLSVNAETGEITYIDDENGYDCEFAGTVDGFLDCDINSLTMGIDDADDLEDEIAEEYDEIEESLTIVASYSQALINGHCGRDMDDYKELVESYYENFKDEIAEESFEDFYEGLSFFYRRKYWYYNKEKDIDESDEDIFLD